MAKPEGKLLSESFILKILSIFSLCLSSVSAHEEEEQPVTASVQCQNIHCKITTQRQTNTSGNTRKQERSDAKQRIKYECQRRNCYSPSEQIYTRHSHTRGTVLGAQERAEQGKHYTFSQRISANFCPMLKFLQAPIQLPGLCLAVGMMGKLVLLSSSNYQSPSKHRADSAPPQDNFRQLQQ